MVLFHERLAKHIEELEKFGLLPPHWFWEQDKVRELKKIVNDLVELCTPHKEEIPEIFENLERLSQQLNKIEVMIKEKPSAEAQKTEADSVNNLIVQIKKVIEEKIEEKKYPKIFPLEKVIPKCLPLHTTQIDDFCKRKPGYYSVPKKLRGHVKEAGEVLHVDLLEYLDVYGKLLENPQKVYSYVRLLEPEVQEALGKCIKNYGFAHSAARRRVTRDAVDQIFSREELEKFDSGRKFFEAIEEKLPDFLDKCEINDEDVANAYICLLFGVTDHSWIEFELNPNVDLQQFEKHPVLESISPLYKPAKGYKASSRIFRGCLSGLIWPCLAVAEFDDYLKEKINAISFHSEFELPLGNKKTNREVFDGLKKTIALLIKHEYVSEVDFIPGDYSCFVPIYRRNR